jgi:LPXTG-motif cell wall-anchored protein
MRKRLLTRLAAAGAGGALALAMATPAFAVGTPEGFNQADDLPITADDGEFENCEDTRWAELNQPEDHDGWHFVAGEAGSFKSIKLTFQMDPEDDTSTVSREGFVEPGDPGDFIFQDSGPNLNHHATIFTPAGWLLTDAEAELSGAEFFVLSSTCAGVPGPDPTPTPTPTPTTPPSEEEEEDPREDPKEEDEDPDELPVTGAQLGGLLVLAGGLLAAGVAMLFVRRRQSLANLLES